MNDRERPAAFDPCFAHTAETQDQAIALATAWADGRRSWINVVHADTEERRMEVVAVMDAQEVVKWGALAVALAQLDLVELQRQVAIDGAAA